MTRLVLPLTVRCADGEVDLLVRAARPVPWSLAHPRILATLGLPPGRPLYLGVGRVEPDWLLGTPPLVAGCLLGTEPETALPECPLVVLAVVAGPDAGRTVPLAADPIAVGRDPLADLVLTDPQASFRHALLRPTAAGLAVIDLGSTNGVQVDGVPAAAAGPATTGSLIRIGGSLLQIQLAAEQPGPLTPDGAGHLVRSSAPPPQASRLPPAPAAVGPPPQRQLRPVPLLSAAVGAAAGGSLAVLLHSPLYLAFAALGPVTMLASAWSDRAAGRRSHRRRLREWRRAVVAHDAAVAAMVDADRHDAWQRWPGPAALLRRTLAGGAALWDRAPGDEAYLRLAVGSGARATRAAGGDPDPAAPAVTDVPVTVDLAATPVLGLAGEGGRALARWLILQLAALHSPGDVALLLVDPGADLRPCRDLPHVPGAVGGPHRCRPGDEGADLVGDPASIGARDLVAVLDGRRALRSPLAGVLLAAARRRRGGPSDRAAAGRAGRTDPDDTAGRVCVLCLAREATDLPADRLELDAPRTALAGALGPVDVTGIDMDLLRRACRALIPLRDGAARGATGPPPYVSLADLVGPVDADSLARRWLRPTLWAPLGCGPAGPVGLDLQADGPHLLIAGTTGAGKSELLLTLVCGLSVAAPPQELTFLLVDYKGGSAFAAVAELPHVVGVVTDLDPALSARALASLRAELRRRERLTAAGGPAPPRLVLVIDEFATLAVELPEFLAGVLDIAQRGRSLGLHLVLATQRPAGVVSPAVRANVGARLCLRVTDPAESLDVIGVPDAARIPPGIPGRALLRAGSGVVPFQAALASAPVGQEITIERRDPPRLRGTAGRAGDAGATADTAATRSECAAATPARDSAAANPDGQAGPGPTTVDAIVRAARAAARDRPAPAPPWVPPLPARYRPRDADCLALADLPDEQTRRELSLPDASVLVTGPAGSGRSTALRRIGVVAAGRGGELLVVDPTGGRTHQRQRPTVSSYLGLDEPRLVLRLLALLGEPARRPADGRIRYLLVDGYDLVAAALDRADYVTGGAVLAELPVRSGGAVRLAASAPLSLAQQRPAAAFGALIELGSAGAPPMPGRGRWAGTTVQIADAPCMAPPPDARRWADPLVVRPLPAAVPLATLPAARPAAVPLGLGGDDATPLTVDLAGPGGALVVAGPRGSGVSTALTVLAAGAAGAGITVLRADPASPAHRAPPDPRGVARLDPRAGPEPLRAALAGHSGPLLLVVDQCGIGAETAWADVLERFCRVCGPGQYLVIGERPDLLSRAHRGHLRTAMSFRRGLLLAPDAQDGAVLDVPVPRRTGPVPPGRGLWVEAGAGRPIQVARP